MPALIALILGYWHCCNAQYPCSRLQHHSLVELHGWMSIDTLQANWREEVTRANDRRNDGDVLQRSGLGEQNFPSLASNWLFRREKVPLKLEFSQEKYANF